MNFGLIAPNTIRGTRDYRKFSQRRQHLRQDMHSKTGSAAEATKNVDKILINYNPAHSKQ
jgi:hypothetical protein